MFECIECTIEHQTTDVSPCTGLVLELDLALTDILRVLPMVDIMARKKRWLA